VTIVELIKVVFVYRVLCCSLFLANERLHTTYVK